MSFKQDLAGARTAADIERRYNFRKRFSEVMGIASDAQKVAEDAKESAGNPAVNLTQEEIFNLLTNNGEAQAVYREDGQIYINASYIMAGVIDAAAVQVVNLVAEKLKSVLGESQLLIDGATMSLSTSGRETFNVTNWGDGVAYMYFTSYDSAGNDVGRSQFGANQMQIGGTWVNPLLSFVIQNGEAYMSLPEDVGEDGFQKKLSWKDNGDGTYTLTGK